METRCGCRGSEFACVCYNDPKKYSQESWWDKLKKFFKQDKKSKKDCQQCGFDSFGHWCAHFDRKNCKYKDYKVK